MIKVVDDGVCVSLQAPSIAPSVVMIIGALVVALLLALAPMGVAIVVFVGFAVGAWWFWRTRPLVGVLWVKDGQIVCEYQGKFTQLGTKKSVDFISKTPTTARIGGRLAVFESAHELAVVAQVLAGKKLTTKHATIRMQGDDGG